MTQILQPADVRALRLRAQWLRDSGAGSGANEGAGSGTERIAAVARHMLATQGQDWRSARWALGVRAPGTTVGDVHAAFAAGQIVRSWPMRGTLHIVPAEDIGWMQGVTNHRVLAGAPARRRMLGLTDAMLERLIDVSLAALHGGAALDRDALSTAWTEAGIDWQNGWRYHVIWWLCQNGLATFGPVRDSGEPMLVRADEWITAPRTLVGDEALTTLATRYVQARGPVRDRDLAWWTGLTLREVRHGLALAQDTGDVTTATLGATDGPMLWLDPAQLDPAPLDPAPLDPAPLGPAPLDPAPPHASPRVSASGWQLLPAFDEHLLGYTDREAHLAPEHADRIVPGRNGMFLATVVEAGRVRGTWKRGTRARSGVEVSPFPGDRIDAAAITAPLAAWHAFHGSEPLPPSLRPAGETPSATAPRSAKK
ncbi:winged helix DNA-binding domain-containing protein [Leucobacter chromiireducens]|uniref:Winged helix DNA-binding domain-containing protein n=1 Tax=Leucobacter chromiireducens subsp. solipictus TaxID=398235 RepID=A0ABS1SI49_9MICO|nr:winged helix DNA-binding domain-containing protein [Leucobacter chromiireducens]MBL3680076.1 winged helix DNA-binding domain-containing protein [Leucobacter chromiireducens subsp. solipictus]